MPSSHVVLSADSSLAEMTSLLSKMLPSSNIINSKSTASFLEHICIIDASYHPAKCITEILCDNPDKSGPRSKTLQSMGWFPSGKLVILSNKGALEKMKGEEFLLKEFTEWQSRQVLNEEEFGYNLPSAVVHDGSAKNEVHWTGAGSPDVPGDKLKPTDIFNAVQSRFDHELPPSQQQSNQDVQAKKKKQKRTEQQRHQRLDTILNNLKSKKKTSATVRNMLIKSRAEGDKKLRMEDRFHLEIVRVDDCNGAADQVTGDTNEKSDYRFYSRQTTAGKVASGSAPSLGQDRAAEFLVCVAKEEEKRYRRLPNTTSLHDAELKGWINEFDLVLIRIFQLSSHNGSETDGVVGPSKSVLDPESDEESNKDANDDSMEVEATDRKDTISDTALSEEVTTAPKDFQVNTNICQFDLKCRIQTIFHMAESGEIQIENNKPIKSNPKKSVSKQVQNILMKSKAKGDKKIKQEDRVYLEMILFCDSNDDALTVSSISASYRFYEKRKSIGHIIESLDIVKSSGKKNNMEVDFIVHDEENVIRKLPTDTILSDAVQDGNLNNFDRVVVRVCSR